MVKSVYLFSLLFLFLTHISYAQNGCPGCDVNLPQLPSDTIYLGTAPDGVAGEYYDDDLSFRMPKSTTPVNAIDPGTPSGLGIGKITIVSLLNLPPGLDWEPSQFEFDPDNETDGCVKFCGTPLIPGLYEVEVFVTADVSLISQSTSFSFPFYIAPSTSNNDGFTMQNSNGCGEVTVGFENNVPSNGANGYSYSWDFGNGETSTLEVPGAITYGTPGIYEVSYEAVIDTFGYELTTVRVVAASCDDTAIPPIFNGAPDLYIKIKDPNGDQIFSTSPVTNSPIPSAFNVNLKLGSGDYQIEVRDDDLFGSDHCGTVVFNQFTNDTLTVGSLKVVVDIIHPIFTVQSTDTVRVFPIPEQPVIVPGGTIDYCNGETVELTTDHTDNLQWYKDSIAILGEIGPTFSTSSKGLYWVECTTDNGCKSVSDPIVLNENTLPLPPSFSSTGNLLSVNNTSLLPTNYTLQWYLDSDPIVGANDTTYCNTIDGVSLYALEVTDNSTGCSNEFSIGIAFDPDFNCLLSSNDEVALEKTLRLYPNPVYDFLTVEFFIGQSMDFEISIADVNGRIFRSENTSINGYDFKSKLDVSSLPNGLYLLKITTKEGQVTRKFTKQNF